MTTTPFGPNFRAMQSPETSAGLPLAYVAEIIFELTLMRQECCKAAATLIDSSPVDEVGLEECAVLDESMAKAHRTLHFALKTIRDNQERRKGPRP